MIRTVAASNSRFITSLRKLCLSEMRIFSYGAMQTSFGFNENRCISVTASSLFHQSSCLNSKDFQRKKLKGEPTKSTDTDSDSDDEDDGDGNYTADEKKQYVLNIPRAENILKKVFKLKRRAIETAFYEGKLRLNDKKIMKKSIRFKQGDRIDFIKGHSPIVQKYLLVDRVEVKKISVNLSDDTFIVSATGLKSLAVENYPDGDPWIQSAPNEEKNKNENENEKKKK